MKFLDMINDCKKYINQELLKKVAITATISVIGVGTLMHYMDFRSKLQTSNEINKTQIQIKNTKQNLALGNLENTSKSNINLQKTKLDEKINKLNKAFNKLQLLSNIGLTDNMTKHMTREEEMEFVTARAMANLQIVETKKAEPDLIAYNDKAVEGGRWTVCYGETKVAKTANGFKLTDKFSVKPGDRYTKNECNQMLEQSLKKEYVKEIFKKIYDKSMPESFKHPPSVIVSIVLHAYNMGINNKILNKTLVPLLKVKDTNTDINYNEVCKNIGNKGYFSNKFETGLVKRRGIENVLCDMGINGFEDKIYKINEKYVPKSLKNKIYSINEYVNKEIAHYMKALFKKDNAYHQNIDKFENEHLQSLKRNYRHFKQINHDKQNVLLSEIGNLLNDIKDMDRTKFNHYLNKIDEMNLTQRFQNLTKIIENNNNSINTVYNKVKNNDLTNLKTLNQNQQLKNSNLKI